MGGDVEFYAFREAPDVTKLEKINWLPAWRLFKQVDADAWYLEGPTEESAITFFEPLHFYRAKPPKPAKLKALSKTISDRIKQDGGDTSLFDEYAMMLCAGLSTKLGQAVIFAGGNDEGFDCFIVCDNGEVVEAKFDIDWDKAVVVSEGGSVGIEHLFPPGSDESKVTPRMLHQNASEGAAAFFGAEDWLVTSDPYDFDSANYEVVAHKGSAAAKEMRLSDKFWKQFGGHPRPIELINTFEPYIEEILAKDLVMAENDRRFAADKTVGELHRNMNLWRDSSSLKHRHLMKRFHALTAELCGYTHRLRPKPEFRSEPREIERLRRSLALRWRTIKLEGKVLS